MTRASNYPKEESFNFRVPADLKAAFQKATEMADRPAAQVIRDFMRSYVYEHEKPEAGYDAWLRNQIQAAIDDTRPSKAHKTVMKEARSLVNKMEKDSHED